MNKELPFGFEEDLENAVDVLKKGGVILYPTDTIWGLGCDAANPEAVKRIYEIKKRSNSKSMISLVDSFDTLKRWVDDFPADLVEKLISESQQPVTVIYPAPRGLSGNLTADDGSAAIRVTEEIFSQSLCRKLGKPVVSTSANISGESAPQRYSEISDEIKDLVDYVVRYGRDDDEERKPSRIIKINRNNEIEVIR